MALVPATNLIPSVTVTGTVLSLDLADLGVTDATDASALLADIRELSYALDFGIAEKLKALPAEQRPTGMTKTVGAIGSPVDGKRTIPFTTSYVAVDDIRSITFAE